MNQRAFTLLELLVVITIIGILSSIVIVSMSGSTDSAAIAKGKAYAQQVHALLGANAVGVWNFDEGTGTTLTDISGYGNNGTLNKGANGTGLDWVASDIEGTALQFDGVDDYVEISFTKFPKMTSITAEFWIKTNSPDVLQSLFSRYALSGIQFAFFWQTDSKIRFYINSGGDGSYIQSSQILEGDIYHHIVGVFDGTTKNQELFIDGLSSAKRNYDVTLNNPNTNVILGNDGYFGNRYGNGLIDDVRIYSEALSSVEIQKYYVQGLKKFLSSQAITQAEYNQRIKELNQSLVRHGE
jgi:prepilin-type N-terminal cleavage/methylation domain-containing protein